MSGGDSSYPSWSGREQENCLELIEIVRLSSLVEDIVNSLKLKDKMNIVIERNQGVSVVAKDREGNIVGAIAGPSSAKILDCLEKSYEFEGIVIELDDGKCHVEIRCIGKKKWL